MFEVPLSLEEKSSQEKNLGKFAVQTEIDIPDVSPALAELAGIILGDGGITDRQVKITLDAKTDVEYLNFVSDLLIKLFGVIPKIQKRTFARAVDIVVSRTQLVLFWNIMGIPAGNKTLRQADIPTWIKDEAEFQIACLRGLIDTDGCIFNECHTIKNARYCYPRMSFVNKSKPLLNSVHEILTRNGFSAKLRGERAVVLEKREDVIRYFKEIGTHNAKHAKRFFDFTGGVA